MVLMAPKITSRASSNSVYIDSNIKHPSHHRLHRVSHDQDNTNFPMARSQPSDASNGTPNSVLVPP